MPNFVSIRKAGWIPGMMWQTLPMSELPPPAVAMALSSSTVRNVSSVSWASQLARKVSARVGLVRMSA